MDNDLLFESIKELKEELAQIDHAIRQVEAISEGRGLPGRPSRAVAAVKRARAGKRSKKPKRDNDR